MAILITLSISFDVAGYRRQYAHASVTAGLFDEEGETPEERDAVERLVAANPSRFQQTIRWGRDPGSNTSNTQVVLTEVEHEVAMLFMQRIWESLDARP